MRIRLLFILVGGLALFLTACRSGVSGPTRDSAVPTAQPGAATEALSLYEQRLLRAIDEMAALDEAAAAAEEKDRPGVERQFHRVAGTFNSIIADNPDQIEVRLIYAKLLDRFGDREGALGQCAEVLLRDPGVAVAHQMVGTFFAEEGDHAKALAYYLNAVGAAPDEATYHFGLGDLLYTFRPGFLEDGIFTAESLDEKTQSAFRRAAELAPDELPYQFRYGESFYDLPEPSWSLALEHWARLARRSDLTPLQEDALRLHQARCLGELGRYEEARAMAEGVGAEGLQASRSALLAAIEEAAGG
jgi:tetratricopeptide (TPR) repeat protein